MCSAQAGRHTDGGWKRIYGSEETLNHETLKPDKRLSMALVEGQDVVALLHSSCIAASKKP